MTYILEQREYLCVVEANLTTAVTAVAISAARRLMRCRKHIGTFFFFSGRALLTKWKHLLHQPRLSPVGLL